MKLCVNDNVKQRHIAKLFVLESHYAFVIFIFHQLVTRSIASLSLFTSLSVNFLFLREDKKLKAAQCDSFVRFVCSNGRGKYENLPEM